MLDSSESTTRPSEATEDDTALPPGVTGTVAAVPRPGRRSLAPAEGPRAAGPHAATMAWKPGAACSWLFCRLSGPEEVGDAGGMSSKGHFSAGTCPTSRGPSGLLCTREAGTDTRPRGASPWQVTEAVPLGLTVRSARRLGAGVRGAFWAQRTGQSPLATWELSPQPVDTTRSFNPQDEATTASLRSRERSRERQRARPGAEPTHWTGLWSPRLR